MGSEVVVGKGVLDEILARARWARNEVCGLLLGTPGRIDAVLHCANVAADPATTFEIDPAQLIAAHRAAREGGAAILGCYHSHPCGSPDPSPRDAAAAPGNGWLWLIVAQRAWRMVRAVEHGELHARFVPVAVSLSTSPAGTV